MSQSTGMKPNTDPDRAPTKRLDRTRLDLQRFRRGKGGRGERSSPLLVAGAVIIGTLGLIAVFADVLAPYDPQDPRAGLPLEQPSASHLLGTNDSGQDIFSQLIAGTRSSMLIAVEAAAVVVLIGGLVGMIAGLVGGWLDTVLMRVADIFMALPGLPLASAPDASAGTTDLVPSLSAGVGRR